MDYSKAVKGKFKLSYVMCFIEIQWEPKNYKILLIHILSVRAVQSMYLEVEPPIQRIVSKVYFTFVHWILMNHMNAAALVIVQIQC